MRVPKPVSFNRSIKSIIFLPVYLFSLAFIFIVGILVWSLGQSYEELNLQLTRSVALQVNDHLGGRVAELENMALMMQGVEPYLSEIQAQELFERSAQAAQQFESVLLMNKQGYVRYLWPYDESLLGLDLSSLPSFKLPQMLKGSYWSNTFLSPQTSQSTVTVTLNFAQAIAQANLNLNHLGSELKRIADLSDAHLILLDGQGTYLVHPDQGLVQQRAFDFDFALKNNRKSSEPFSYYSTVQSKVSLVSAQVLPDTGWFVLIAKPLEKIYSPLVAIFGTLIPMLILVLIMAIVLSRLADKHLIRALENLREETRKISEGDYTRTLTKTRYKDLNDILIDFESMRESIWLREQDLRDSEYRFRRMFEEAAIGILHTTFDGEPLDLNFAMARILGYSSPEDAIEHLSKPEFGLYVRPEERQAILQMLKTSPHGKIQIGTEFYTKSKTVLDVNIYLGRVFDSHRSEFILEAFVEDITEIRKAEREIRQLNLELEKKVQERTKHLEKTLEDLNSAQYQLVQAEKMAALGQLISGIAHEINTPLGAISASNDNIVAILKRVLENLPRILNAMPKELRPVFDRLYQRSNRDFQLISSLELRQHRKRVFEILSLLEVEATDELVDNLAELGAIDDLPEYKPLLVHPMGAEIVQVVGEMVSLDKSSAIISEASDKAAKVIKALRTFTHQNVTEDFSKIQLLDGIETVLTLFQNRLKHGVEVVTRVIEEGEVWGYQDKLNQVWTNLINNALQAMDYKGTLEIEIGTEGQRAKVSIIDSGSGIPENIRDKIFQPFFTTKKAGEGSGLGLDICQKIVAEHKGEIVFESVPGRTRFTVYLPLVLKE